MALGQGLSLNKFSTMKNIGQKCAKCGKTNRTMQNHWPGGKNPNKKCKGQNKSQKLLNSSGKEKTDKRGRAKRKKRHKQVPMYYLYQNSLICPYKQQNQLIFHATRQVRKWNGAWIVGVQITSHQVRVILFSIGN